MIKLVAVDARDQTGDPRLDSVHRCGRRLALAKGAEVHTPLSARQRTDAHLRLCRSHFDFAVHADIRGGGQQRR